MSEPPGDPSRDPGVERVAACKADSGRRLSRRGLAILLFCVLAVALGLVIGLL